jgi:hypothetical protein
MTDELLTIDEAARLAHVSTETIKYWIKTKRLATEPIRTSARSGRPYGKLVRRRDLLSAAPRTKADQMKSSHPGNLLTVGEVRSTLRIRRELAYILVNRFELEKHYIDGCQYMVDGEELWGKMREDPIYWYLTLRK